MIILRDILNNHFLAFFALVFCALNLRRRDRPVDFLVESTTMVLWTLALLGLCPKLTIEALGEGSRLVIFETMTPLWLFLALLWVFRWLPDLRPIAPVALIAAFLADPGLLTWNNFSGGSMAFTDGAGLLNLGLLLAPGLFFLPRNLKDLQFVLLGLLMLFLGIIPALILAAVRFWSQPGPDLGVKKATLLGVLAGLFGVLTEGQMANHSLWAAVFALVVGVSIWGFRQFDLITK